MIKFWAGWCVGFVSYLIAWILLGWLFRRLFKPLDPASKDDAETLLKVTWEQQEYDAKQAERKRIAEQDSEFIRRFERRIHPLLKGRVRIPKDINRN